MKNIHAALDGIAGGDLDYLYLSFTDTLDYFYSFIHGLKLRHSQAYKTNTQKTVKIEQLLVKQKLKQIVAKQL